MVTAMQGSGTGYLNSVTETVSPQPSDLNLRLDGPLCVTARDRWERAVETMAGLTRQLDVNPEPQRTLHELFDCHTAKEVRRPRKMACRRSRRSLLGIGR